MEVSSDYRSNLNNLKIKFNINDATGYFKGLSLDRYVSQNITAPNVSLIKKMPYQDFSTFFERQNVDKYLSDKYANINFRGYDGVVSGFKLSLNSSVADSKPSPVMIVNANINDKKFAHIYPRFSNKDSYIKADFDGNKLFFTNNTDNYVQILSVSLYYDAYIKTLTLSNNPIELAPQATTLEPILVSKFEDQKLRSLSTYESITAIQAKATTLSFGFAIKYRVVEQSLDKTQYKINKHNLYNLLVSENVNTSELSAATESIKEPAKKKRLKR